MSRKERWLVDKYGNIRVLDVVQLAGIGDAAPAYLLHGGVEYRYVERVDGVEWYEEIESPP